MVAEATQTTRLYEQMHDAVLARDQTRTQTAYYALLRDGERNEDIVSRSVAIHAPYTHVPYHQRIDHGIFRFVNNDHCLLSERAAIRMQEYLPEPYHALPTAQTLWYLPLGLDPWNQLLGRAPGHYARTTFSAAEHASPPMPEVHMADQEPLFLDGSYDEQLDAWLTLVQIGDVTKAYRVWLGLWQAEPQRRQDLLAQYVFAGLINVQDRMLNNRSFTTGHKSHRARAVIELGERLGWENARHVIYAGVPDMAVGPNTHAGYEMACQLAMYTWEDPPPPSSLSLTPGHLPKDAEFFASTEPLSVVESEALIQTILRDHDPAHVNQVTWLLQAGKSPRHILDAIQIAAARLIMETRVPDAFTMPHHGFEYTNTLAWFYDRFNHPHRTKLLYVAAGFINQVAHFIRDTPGNGRSLARPPAGADRLSGPALLTQLDGAIMRLDTDETAAWSHAYLDGGHEPERMVETVAIAAARFGNDPHNQEICITILEDFRRTQSPFRNELLIAAAYHAAGHSKYLNYMESFQRYAHERGIPSCDFGDPAGIDENPAAEEIEQLP